MTYRSRALRPLPVSRTGALFLLAVLAGAAAYYAAGCGGQGRTIEVWPGDGSPVNRAVQSAQPGDTILLHAGTYLEQVELDRDVTLRGADDGDVWIDAGCERDHAIRITASGATVERVGVRRTVQAGVLIQDGAGRVTLEGMTIQDFNCRDQPHQHLAGVAVFYGGPRIRIVGNTIARRVDLPGDEQGYGNGIWFKSDTAHPSGGGHRILENVITGGFDGIGGEAEQDPHGSFDRDTVIEGNTIAECWDDGIQVEGGNRNVRVRENTIQGCGIGIAFAPNLEGPLYIEGNVIRDLEPGQHGAQAAFKLGGGGAGVAHLTENVVETEGTGILQTDRGLSRVVARRNVIRVDGYVIAVDETFPEGTSLDRDCLWTEGHQGWLIKWGGTHYDDLERFARETGHERHGDQSGTCEGA